MIAHSRLERHSFDEAVGSCAKGPTEADPISYYADEVASLRAIFGASEMTVERDHLVFHEVRSEYGVVFSRYFDFSLMIAFSPASSSDPPASRSLN